MQASTCIDAPTLVGELGQLRDRIDDTLRVLRCRADDEHGVVGDVRGHRIDVREPLVVDVDLVRVDAEVVRGLVERRMRARRDHHVGRRDAALLAGALARGLDGHQDALRATRRHEAGGRRRTVEQGGGRADHLRLDLAEAREGARVQRVLVQEHLGGGACDLVDFGTAVVDHAEGSAVLPARVTCALGLQVREHLGGRQTAFGETHGRGC